MPRFYWGLGDKVWGKIVVKIGCIHSYRLTTYTVAHLLNIRATIFINIVITIEIRIEDPKANTHVKFWPCIRMSPGICVTGIPNLLIKYSAPPAKRSAIPININNRANWIIIKHKYCLDHNKRG